MPSPPKRNLIPLALFIFLLLTTHTYGQETYLNLKNPFLRKIPLAVPYFGSSQKTESEIQYAREASELLSETLEFTGYFLLLERKAFLADLNNPDITLAEIKFPNWTGIGAEYLITGKVTTEQNSVSVELRLFDTFKEARLLGKVYRGPATEKRRIIRKFCTEVIYHLFGNRGIFNSRIAFVSNGTGNKEIYLCDFDGYDPIQFTHAKSITLSPAWSSDGQWLAYTSYARGNPDLYIRAIKEKRGSVVARKGLNITPAWRHGRSELAATLSYTGDPEIYMLTGKGKIIKRLTQNWGTDVSPTFSPDGKQMAFVSDRSGSPQIYIMDLESGQIRRLTFQGRYNTQPSWSPRGDKVAYASLENGTHDIMLMNPDGSELVQLTRDTGNNESPTWAPDGSMIAFSSTREGQSRIYVMTAFGTDQRRLLLLPGEQFNPSWSPGTTAN